MTELDEQRMVALETRLAHFERMAEDLSDMVAHQADAIDRMETQLRRLRERVIDLAAGVQSAPQDERPPPHY